MTNSERYNELLRAYGANAENWPAEERVHWRDAGASTELQTGQEHEAALDRLLDQASQPDPPAGAQERILAKIAGENVVPLTDAVRSGQDLPAPAGPWFAHGNLAAGMALAASLVFGIYLGASGSIGDMFPGAITGDDVFETADLDEPQDIGETLDDVEADG